MEDNNEVDPKVIAAMEYNKWEDYFEKRDELERKDLEELEKNKLLLGYKKGFEENACGPSTLELAASSEVTMDDYNEVDPRVIAAMEYNKWEDYFEKRDELERKDLEELEKNKLLLGYKKGFEEYACGPSTLELAASSEVTMDDYNEVDPRVIAAMEYNKWEEYSEKCDEWKMKASEVQFKGSELEKNKLLLGYKKVFERES